MRIIFLGSSELSVIALKALIEKGHEILGVVCQPDKPNTRGNKIEISELKKFAISKNISLYQFEKIKNGAVEVLKNLNPELLVVVYYGQILSQNIIDLGSKGILNLHPSLLPKYRGPSPVITPILNGDKETGVSIMRVEKAVDSGNILAQTKVKIEAEETAGQLWERLTSLGAKMLVEVIKQLEKGKLKETKQDDSKVTFTRMFTKTDAKIDFNRKCHEIVNHIRGFHPNPFAYTFINGNILQVCKAKKLLSEEILKMNLSPLKSYKNGEVVSCNPKIGFIIKAADGFISLLEVKPQNGKIMSAKDFLNGKKVLPNMVLGE